MKTTAQTNINAEIAGLAKRHGINISANAIDQFVSAAGVRELHEGDLNQVVGAAIPNEKCTKFFTFPSSTWTF